MHHQVRTFKLERILSLERTGTRFRKVDFDLDRYLGRAWQMIPEGRIYHVRIRFSPMVAGNVEEVLWHPTQRTYSTDDGSLIFEADVDGLREICWWVLGYGDQAVVEQPRELRELVATKVHRMAQAYGLV